jgi:AraC-like DNA-binding protein
MLVAVLFRVASMSLLRTVQKSGRAPGASVAPAGREPFFETHDPLRLHDGRSGFSRTDAATLGPIAAARVVSTGHDIGVTEQDCITLLAPRSGRIMSETSGGVFRSGAGGALLFWPNRRATRVERGAAPLFEAAALRIPPKSVVAAAERLDRGRAGRLGGAGIALSLDPARMRGVATLTDYCAALLEELDRPDSLLSRPRARDRAAEQIMETLVEILEAAGALPAPDGVADAAAARTVRAAEIFMRARYDDIVSIGEVARAAGVGVRALQLAFGAVRGRTPRQALAEIRLAAARARLAAPEAGETVSGAALDCGFTHLGRFSAAYRARFGESPSVTLERARGA